tara:strand:+ start:1231 stop:1485 length:255 start_codon:yes stop_codon:yes gene_type:complete
MSFSSIREFDTEHYHIIVDESVVRDYEGSVYQIRNKLTLVSEHETPYFSEALGYILALEEKLVQAIDLYHEKVNESKVGVPGVE